jgi:acyl carrier protein
MSDTHHATEAAVRSFLLERIRETGRSVDVDTTDDFFSAGLLDSQSLTALIARVEAATGRSVDFLEVDPEQLGSVEEIAAQLVGAFED